VAFEFHHEMLADLDACVQRLHALGDYRFGIFLDEWNDPVGGHVPAEALVDKVRALPPDSWGMIVARMAESV
jgi:hypothetical protein